MNYVLITEARAISYWKTSVRKYIAFKTKLSMYSQVNKKLDILTQK